MFLRGTARRLHSRNVPARRPSNARSLGRRIAAWFAVHARKLPWRGTRDPYAIWISEIMLQQTQVKTVIPYYERWMREWPTLAAFAAADADRVLKLWEGLGYYRRARHAQEAAKRIVDKYGGRFPEQLEEILALPGVGRYTAGAICSIAFNVPAPILDGNVIRVLCRVYGVTGNPRGKSANERLWRLAGELALAAPDRSALNQGLMELGALVCLPRNPQCGACPVRADCVARRTGRTETLPMLDKRPPPLARRFAAFLARRNGRFLVRRRPADGVNAGLWEFPNVETGADGKLPEEARLFSILDSKPVCRIRHSITRHRILLEVFSARLAGSGTPPGCRWVAPEEMKQLAFTGAHRKIPGLARRADEIKTRKRPGRPAT